MAYDTPWQPLELHTRLLYPFCLRQERLEPAVEALTRLTVAGRQGDVAVWECVVRPHEFYRQELLATVSAFLFPNPADAACQGRGCRYLRVSENRLNAWFRQGLLITGPNGVSVPARLAPGPGIELFLSPDGVGLLSIAFLTAAAQWGEQPFGPDALLRFNYRLSQLSRQGTTPTLALPPSPQAPAPPAPDALFMERLGKAGGAFTLAELRDFLLAPAVAHGGLKPVQPQFSVYTVVRFGPEADFAQPAVRAQLGRLLSGLAQIEEETHAGALPGEELDVVNRVMNTRHWAAVGCLGVAHLVADQEPPHPFDEQRVAVVRDKYFIPYLTAFLQRLTLHHAIARAAEIVRGPESERVSRFRRLHARMLDFTVTGHFTEVSSREALNRYYRMAQEGLGVDKALAVVSRAIQSHNADQATRDLSDNVRTVSRVQRKVEWLEVFFVSFYATELSHLIAGYFFSHGFGAVSVLFWPVFAGGLALWGLQPWRHASQEPKPKRRGVWVTVILLLAVLIWFGAGWLWFGNPHATASDHAALTGDLPAVAARQ